MNDTVLSAAEVLGTHGPLSQHLAGFRVRAAQQAMADAIAAALTDKQDLLVEAGTGTGKTLAYLVPAMLSGMKIIISTGTKNLQDQLINRDVPLLRQALKIPVSVSVLKGRSNYLCLHRYDQAQQEPTLDKIQVKSLRTIKNWSDGTRHGDIAECSDLSESDPFWIKVTSTVDNCLGQDCEVYDKCYLVKARRDAQAADVVIVNHHLLLSDMALQQSGFGELLPGADAYIIDEAHQLPEIASQYFGLGFSTAQAADLATDCAQAYHQDINETAEFAAQTDLLSRRSAQLRDVFGSQQRRAPWVTLAQDANVQERLTQFYEALYALRTQLQPLAERSKDLATCLERCEILLERYTQMTQPAASGFVHWFEVHRRSVSLHMTPLDIAATFHEHRAHKPGVWIFTSATLTVAGKFEHFTSRLGLHDARCMHWDSPFDYQHNTLMYLPPDMPEPNSPNYIEKVVWVTRQVLSFSRGRAFVLFTSHRAMQDAWQRLRGSLPYPLFVQGDMSRDVLLEKFRATPNAVLLGTSSFWEGVDVRGEALSCVIIDKLPFATPDDPVLQARIDALRARGANPFMDYQLPSAVIALKQGAGRLIRDYDDRGVLVLCDPRLRSKPYGKIFLNSLPPMPVTRDEQDVLHFFMNQSREMVN